MVESSVGEGWVAGADQWGRWIVDPVSGLRFRPLPPGEYSVGLSDRERRAAQRIESQPQWSVEEMTPVATHRLGPAWVADVPVSCSIARSAHLPVSGGDREPALLTTDEVDVLCDQFGWRRLSEAEWETCCRAGRGDLFAWGDQIPDAETLGEWLSWDMADMGSLRNSWGFGSLFFGEWCEDRFRLDDDADAAPDRRARVIKGGGAQFWPWQSDQEWVWCVSAMRMPSTDLFADRRAAFRPALQLAPDVDNDRSGNLESHETGA